MRTRTSTTLLGVALLAGITVLTACGSGSGNGTSSAPTAAPNPDTAGIKISNSSLGPLLTDEKGQTLYAFTNDKGGTSRCTAQCIATWPALVSRQPVTAGAGANQPLLSETKRAEGTVQATYGQWPLYYYAGDLAPGDVDGQGVDGVWFAVGTDGKLIKTNPSSGQ
jgi:predicted lipoprotein with Yx(FWY)xxD motif